MECTEYYSLTIPVTYVNQRNILSSLSDINHFPFLPFTCNGKMSVATVESYTTEHISRNSNNRIMPC